MYADFEKKLSLYTIKSAKETNDVLTSSNVFCGGGGGGATGGGSSGGGGATGGG